MEHAIIGRILLTGVCGIQGLAPLAIELNRTHATNPLWTRHARFHLVWQASSYALLAGMEAALIWWRGPYPDFRFYLAVALALVPMMAFVIAFISCKLYGGGLSDPNGIPAAKVAVRGREYLIETNFLAVVAGLVMLAVIMGICLY